MSRMLSTIALLLLLSGGFGCKHTDQIKDYPPEEQWQTYESSDGRTFRVAFLKEGKEALLNIGEANVRLKQVVSASGAKYSNGKITFWTKGDRAFVEIDNQMVYRDCRLQWAAP